MPRAPFGRMVRYVSLRGEIVTGLVTAAFEENQVNLHLFRDGVNEEHLPTHVYTVPYAPVHPNGSVVPNSWHWPPRD
ncbi:hypothetical protein [Methylorubrum suomiense]|nr:hypothetical protein [Methylorubrum suomiense]